MSESGKITRDSAAVLAKVARQVLGGQGIRLQAATMGPPRRRGAAGSATKFMVMAAAPVRDGSNWRWVYKMQAATYYGPAWGSWVGAGPIYDVYNTYEVGNGSVGMLGIGITVESIPTGLSLQPVPGTAWPYEAVLVGGTWWISVPNMLGGTCGG